MLTRDPHDREKLVADPAAGKDSVHDRLAGLLS